VQVMKRVPSFRTCSPAGANQISPCSWASALLAKYLGTCLGPDVLRIKIISTVSLFLAVYKRRLLLPRQTLRNFIKFEGEGPFCTFGDRILLAGSENVVLYGVLCECRQLYQVTPDVTLATLPTETNSEIHTLQNCSITHFLRVQYLAL
jgi:hypothetical protein